jgi:DNA-directed RNA polymerase specialized sigma24 family protein
VLATKRGDGQAFWNPLTRYEPKILVLALRYAPVREDAKDIVQQNFPKGFIHLHRFEGKSSFFACRSKT